MVSFLSCECSDQAGSDMCFLEWLLPPSQRPVGGTAFLPRFMPGIHAFLQLGKNQDAGCGSSLAAPHGCPQRHCGVDRPKLGRMEPNSAMLQRGLRPACFPALLAPNRDREIGGGR